MKELIDSGQHTVEFGVIAVEGQLRLKEEDVFPNERRISCSAVNDPPMLCAATPWVLDPCAMFPCAIRTSNTVATHTSHQAIDPIRVLLCLTDNHGVAFLEDLVYRDQSLECLNLVGEDRLPEKDENMSATFRRTQNLSRSPDVPETYTFMPAQKAADDLWSHV